MALRFQDPIYRKNLYGIEEIIIKKKILELKENKTNPYKYYKHIYKLFIQTNVFIKRFSIFSIGLFYIPIFLFS